MVTFLLDGNEVPNPKGWETMKTTIKRDADMDGILIYQDNELEFTGEGYDYLWSKAQSEGFCSRIEVDVTKQYNGLTKRVLNGYIYVSDTTFNEKARTARVKIEDNTFFNTINNNKNLKVVLTAGKSKNGVDITPCTKFDLEVYNIANDTVLRNCFAIRLDDAFRYLIEYMSDGRVGFASDTFAYGGIWGEYVITDGSKLSGYNATIYEAAPITAISFKEMYDEVKKRFPIGFAIENPFTNPVLRIEALSYFSSTDKSTVVFSDIDQISTRFEQSKLYSALNLGSTVTKDGTAFLDFPEDIDFFGFKDETYSILGDCNVDNTLSLVGDWVVSSNIIQDCTVENNQDNDEAIFLIETIQTSEFIGRTRNTNFLNLPLPASPPDNIYYYNESLTNLSVANRYLGLIPNSIAQYFAPNGTGNFTAATSADVTNTGINPSWQIVADAVSVNVGAHYDAGTGVYTAYTGGVFDFEVNVQALTDNDPFNGYVRIMIYDVTGTLRVRGAAFGANTGVRTARYVMSEGETAKLIYYSGNTTGVSITSTVYKFSYWKCTANTGTGGVFKDYDPADYAVNIHEFQYPMDETTIDTLTADPTKLIRFYSDATFQRYAWISEMNINLFTGIAQVKLITSQSNGN